MKKKVLIDLERMRYPKSGVANVAKFLALGLSEQLNKDLFSVFGPKETLESLNTGMKVLGWKSYHKFLRFFYSKYKIVHVTHQLSSYFHFKNRNQIKIVTLHDLNFLHEELRPNKYKKTLAVVQKNVGNADVVVCISDFVKQDFTKNKSLFRLKINQKVVVIHNGLQFPDADKKFDLGNCTFLKNKDFILNIGVFFPKKNQLSILKMMPFLDEDLVFVVSGAKKEYEDQILSFIEENNLSERVHILRSISDEEKYALLQHCKTLFQPSLAEGFGIPPIEAMYFGKPVFLSTFTSLPEIGGEKAFYFEDFDTEKMVSCYKESMAKFQMNEAEESEKIKAWAQQFDYQKMAQAYCQLYRETLNA